MKTQPDFYKSLHPHGPSLESVTSPITLFVRTTSGVLKVSAIQWDYKPGNKLSDVAGSKWFSEVSLLYIKCEQC